MEYTITPQYHEKKGTEIYVLRLMDKVDRDVFTELSQLAKKYKGYYSSFRGVNGYVFKTEDEAESFGEEIDGVLKQSQCAEAKNFKESLGNYSEVELIPLEGGMELHEALRHIIQKEGKEIITQVRLVNILDDFNAYSNMPTAKYILRAIITDGITQSLLNIGEWNNESKRISDRFVSYTGFITDQAIKIIQSVAYGLGWITDEFKIKDNSQIPKNNYSHHKPSTQKVVKKWTKGMNDEETDLFFKSILIYDKSEEDKYKVALENLSFWVDEDDDLRISCELHKKYRKQYSVNLMYAFYDFKGRVVCAPTETCVGYVSPTDGKIKPISIYVGEMKANNIGKILLYWQSPDFIYC